MAKAPKIAAGKIKKNSDTRNGIADIPRKIRQFFLYSLKEPRKSSFIEIIISL